MASLVQFKTSSASTSVASIDVTFDSAPTTGNLLVAVFFTRSTTRSLASGWSEAVFVNNSTESDQLAIAYKKAGVSESSTTTWAGSPNDTHAVIVMEFAPTSNFAWDTSPFDQSASTGRTASVTSLSTGTTSTLSTVNSIAVSGLGIRDDGTAFSWTNSFTHVADIASTQNSSDAQAAAGWKDLSATTGVETTGSWTTALTAMAAVATFTESQAQISKINAYAVTDLDGTQVSKVSAYVVTNDSGAPDHGTTGVLLGGGANLSGTASRTPNHQTTGVLTGSGADLVGTASITAASTITATDLTNHRIYQRISGARDIVFSGTNTGETPNHVQVQIYASDGTTVEQAWTTLTSATITGTTFTGTLSVPEGGMYRFAVRSRNSGNTVLATSAVTTNLWGVGAILSLIGDSALEQVTNSDSGTGFTPNTNVRRYNGSNVWAAAGTDGAIIQAVNTYNTDQGVPVGFMEGASGGTTLVQWSDDTNGIYTGFLSDLSNVGGKVEAAIIHVGTNDAIFGNITSKTAHNTAYELLLSNIRRDTGQASLPIFILGTNGVTSAQDEQFNWQREIERDLADNVANTYYTNVLDIETGVDNVHPSNAGYLLAVDRTALALKDVFGAGTYHRGPKVTDFTASGTTGTANITHTAGTDIVVNTAHGFSASDGSGALAITSATRGSPTTINFVFGRTISGTPVLHYGFGARPLESGQGVRDNTTEALPLDVYINIPIGTTNHTSSGVLTGSGAVIVGSASSSTERTSSGVLTGSGADLVGTANRTREHDNVGVLLGGGANLSGTASRTREHTNVGVLLGGGANLSGTASSSTERTSSGVLTGSGADLAGTANRTKEHATTGALVGQGAVIVGAAALTITPRVTLSGTITASTTETDINLGGKTIILTLTNDTWVP